MDEGKLPLDPRLVRLRVELYTAAQSLKDEDADEFWKLIEEIHSIRFMHDPKAIERVATEIRHRNEDLVPGRIVHILVFDRQKSRCIAAILVGGMTTPSQEFRAFPPVDLAAVLHEHWTAPRDDAGASHNTWHFSIACPFKSGVASG